MIDAAIKETLSSHTAIGDTLNVVDALTVIAERAIAKAIMCLAEEVSLMRHKLRCRLFQRNSRRGQIQRSSTKILYFLTRMDYNSPVTPPCRGEN